MNKKILALMASVAIFATACQTQTPEEENENPIVNPPEEEVEVEVMTEDVATEELNGFLAKPAEEGDYPGVVMIHEWWGLNEHIKDQAEVLAAEGYVVLAVDLYGEVATESAKAQELSGKVRENQEAATTEMQNAVQYLKDEEGVTKVASLGWCFGGGQSLQLALNEPLDATVIYYGNLVTDKEQLDNITWPILGIFGDKDTNVTPESVWAFEAALNELGIENEINMYPEVGHAFANPSNDNYMQVKAMDAWDRTVKFLEENLKS